MRRSSTRVSTQLTRACSGWRAPRRADRAEATRRSYRLAVVQADAVATLADQPVGERQRTVGVAIVEVVEEHRQVDAGDHHHVAMATRGGDPTDVARAAPD